MVVKWIFTLKKVGIRIFRIRQNWLELQISQDNDREPNLTEQNAESEITKHKGPDTEIQPMNTKILPETQNDLFSILLTEMTTNLNMGKKWTEPSLRSQITCAYH